MEKFLRQSRGCRDQNAPLSISTTALWQQQQQGTDKIWAICTGCCTAQKMLLFIAFSDFEESLAACDGRRYFIFQTVFFTEERCRDNKMSLGDILFLHTVLFDARQVMLGWKYSLCTLLKQHLLFQCCKLKKEYQKQDILISQGKCQRK